MIAPAAIVGGGQRRHHLNRRRHMPMCRGLKKEVDPIMSTKMKVLLVQDVDKLGSAGDVKEVSGGYGRNYLMPKGLAVLATRGQVKQAEERLATQRKRNDLA